MKIIKKFFKKLNNNGSSIIMVVVSMAFIGIIVGALLTAAGYAYKLRMQDLNARDNFYYVEHAMDEIYAGVGSETVANMQEAYIYTVENMVRYDISTQSYVNISNEDAEEMFKSRFMNNVSSNPFFTQADIGNSLAKYISDSSVVLDPSKLYVDREYITVKDKDGNSKQVLNKITIKNVVLNRTVKYNKSSANGYYTQTISTDIEIGNPDFDVLFNAAGGSSMNIFNFAMIADMGVEIDLNQPVTIAGNIYAAADYYNKRYNESTYDSDVSDSDKVLDDSATKLKYTHGSVTSKKYSENDAENTYYNKVATVNNPAVPGQKDYFDGVNNRSMYSGLYIDDTSVSILADLVIVPGTISVMNTGSLSIYGKDGMVASEAEVWADNLVLGGFSSRGPVTTSGEEPTYTGSSAMLRADLYIKDDTELNATASNLKLRGSYYGYGDSTERDSRVFVPTVDLTNFQIDVVDSNGRTVTENRGHYNSSAIIVNGERSTLDLSDTRLIYLAGRSYIELSKNVESADDEEADGDGNTIVNRQTVEFTQKTDDLDSNNPADTVFLRDYKMGDSISLKTNQLAYIPVMYTGVPTVARDLLDTIDLTDGKGHSYYDADLHPALRDSDLFEKYFPKVRFLDKNDKYAIPCIMQVVSGKKYYYYDFQRSYNMIVNAAAVLGPGKVDSAAFVAEFPTAEDYAAGFIRDYVAELNDPNSVIAEYLTDIGDYEGFEAGDIRLPNTKANSDVYIYSSGAITSKVGTAFDVVTSKSLSDLSVLFNTNSYVSTIAGTDTDVLASEYSDQLEAEYNYVKWNLGHFDLTDPKDSLEKTYVDTLLADDDFGEESITPINKFMNFDKITPSTNIKPSFGSDSGTNVLDLSSGYYVWISNDDVTVSYSKNSTARGIVRGMIITKGDVIFDQTVTGFEGLIVAGGKVYVSNNLQTITASAEICRTILRECQLQGDENCEFLLSLFKGYEDSKILGNDEEASEVKSIDNIDYSDVVRFNNWMKNVE